MTSLHLNYMIPFITCIILAIIAIPFIVHICYKHELYDMPNGRKIHKIAVPRLGGLAFLPSMAMISRSPPSFCSDSE